MDFQLDVTPVSQPTYVQSYFDKGRTSSMEQRIGFAPAPERRQQASAKPTNTFVLKPREIARQDVSTQTGAETLRPVMVKPTQQQAAVRSSLVAARETRFALLAKKYEGEPTREDSARLALLTERIRRLQPRVTSHDVDVLTHVVDQVEQVTDSLAQMRQRLGLA